MIYVDSVRGYPASMMTAATRRNGHRWCHLLVDSREELHLFAVRLGLRRSWFQNHPTRWHYDIVPRKRSVALALGAREVSRRELVETLRKRRSPA
jgi:hypothetical protein